MTYKFLQGLANCGIPFSVVDPGTGELVAPDSTPTAAFYTVGGSTPTAQAISATMTNVGVGRYSVQFTAPTLGGSFPSDPATLYYVEVTAVVQGVSFTRIVGAFQLEPANTLASVVSNGGNTATTFKTDLASANNDDYIGALVSFSRTSLGGGQVRKIIDYDGTTKFITLDSALRATPTAGEVFELIVR